MKTKLTVTIEEELIPRAKQYARSRGVSLSRLIEQALVQLSESERSTFSEKWRGRLRAAKRSGDRYRHLAEKYLS